MIEDKTEIISLYVDEAMRFGAAIGSWTKSNVPYHCRAANAAIEAARIHFAIEIKSRMKEWAKDNPDT